MTKLLHLGLVAFALAAFIVPSTAEAQHVYSNGYTTYSPSYGHTYSPAIQYDNNFHSPPYSCNSNVPYYESGQYNYGQSSNDLRNQRLRRVATAAIVAGVVIAATSNDGNRNRNRSRELERERDRRLQQQRQRDRELERERDRRQQFQRQLQRERERDRERERNRRRR